ncbi:hypothetical protein BpHYR1_036582 [Brachionus plicatilis]|uniref:Uncharacterized protein n=1 Tax=Brachionus plicatilis TaxID=10195 RepID=A0A3M7QFF7_BRAPC|nr:hypothetical protein BpHYR1_036582 [Brachionus plicatilis]
MIIRRLNYSLIILKNQMISDMHVGYGQDKSVHYTDGFLRSFGRSARRSMFWIAKINGLKYRDGLKNGLKNTGNVKF